MVFDNGWSFKRPVRCNAFSYEGPWVGTDCWAVRGYQSATLFQIVVIERTLIERRRDCSGGNLGNALTFRLFDSRYNVKLQHRRASFDEVVAFDIEGLHESAIARVKRIAWRGCIAGKKEQPSGVIASTIEK
jgi:hypothetical protein